MKEVSIIGLDLAKKVFEVHGVDAQGEVVVRRSLRRGQLLVWFGRLAPCLVGMEACATAYHWARELGRLGHTVKLIPPSYAKAYVRRNKNDAADAAAICEAVGRPSMRFVAIKSEAQQASAAVHKVRELLMKQRTMTILALRSHLAEFGVVVPEGTRHIAALTAIVANERDERIPAALREILKALVETLEGLETRIDAIDRAMLAAGRNNATFRHLITIPGFGPILSSAMTAMVVDPNAFRSARDFAASLGLVPRQDGTGGKVKLGPISKRGNGHLRRLLVNGAMAVLNTRRAKEDPWLAKLLATKKRKLVAVALANKMARIAWALMMRNEDYRVHPAAA